jgi:transposase
MNPELIQGCGFGRAALSRGDLTEAEWRVLKELLPVERPLGMRGRGRPPQDNRNVINGILWRLRTGSPWRDVPEKYGDWNTIYRRFLRWSKSGVWESVATALAETMAESGDYSIDSTSVRAHLSAAGGKRMARPVVKWFFSAGMNSLHKRIRPFGYASAKMEIRAFRSS